MNTKRSRRSFEKDGGPGASRQRETFGEMPRPPNEDDLMRQGSSFASDVRETARTAGRAVGEQAQAFAADIGHELSRKAEDQKSRGIDAMRAFAGAVNTAAQQLEQQSPQVARHVREAAERLQGLSANIEGRNLNELMRGAADMARSHPTMFFAGAIAAGFALSRFLKSSAAHEETSLMDEQWDLGAETFPEFSGERTGDINHGNP
jgi:hypothetical protein